MVVKKCVLSKERWTANWTQLSPKVLVQFINIFLSLMSRILKLMGASCAFTAF